MGSALLMPMISVLTTPCGYSRLSDYDGFPTRQAKALSNIRAVRHKPTGYTPRKPQPWIIPSPSQTSRLVPSLCVIVTILGLQMPFYAANFIFPAGIVNLSLLSLPVMGTVLRSKTSLAMHYHLSIALVVKTISTLLSEVFMHPSSVPPSSSSMRYEPHLIGLPKRGDNSPVTFASSQTVPVLAQTPACVRKIRQWRDGVPDIGTRHVTGISTGGIHNVIAGNVPDVMAGDIPDNEQHEVNQRDTDS